MTFDLVIRNGHVIDPLTGMDEIADVAFFDGKVAHVAPKIDGDAHSIREAAGLYVLPGLIDLHTHVYPGGTSLGIDPARIAISSGTTTAVDAGSAGANNFAGLVDHVIPKSPIRILAFMNISHVGIFMTPGIRIGEAEHLEFLDIDRCVNAVGKYREHVVGVKIRVGASTTGKLGAVPLHMAIRAAEMAGDLPVMVHVGADLPPTLEEIVDPLRPGDILTHYCSPKRNSPLKTDGKVRDCILAARQRGVIMDLGHGGGSFGFDIGRAMLAQGMAPDVISSDVHAYCIEGVAPDVLDSMTKFLELGMPLNDVVRAATATPAAVCRRPDIGTLRPGSAGDATLVELREGRFPLVDSIGKKIEAKQRLVPRGVVIAGRWWHDGEAATKDALKANDHPQSADKPTG